MIRNQLQFFTRHRPALALLLMLTAGVGVAHAQAQAAGGGPREGITVHGHWEIEVRNPDGSLAERREFENALVQTGGQILAQLLGATLSPGPWVIRAQRTGGYTYIVPPPPAANPTLLAGSNNLNVAVLGASLVLSGSFNATFDGSISGVGTFWALCDANQSPTGCLAFPRITDFVLAGLDGNNTAFTATNVQVAVQTGQIVQIRVTLSFS